MPVRVREIHDHHSATAARFDRYRICSGIADALLHHERLSAIVLEHDAGVPTHIMDELNATRSGCHREVVLRPVATTRSTRQVTERERGSDDNNEAQELAMHRVRPLHASCRRRVRRQLPRLSRRLTL